ncbi:hypothetical protein BGZ98_008003 [Dissophora globulifera]|nr:hypothetical protein BGZ98_008003 [Dissophora globulifera]
MRSSVISLSLHIAAAVGCLSSFSAAAPASSSVSSMGAPRPVVFYHGMGDSAHSAGMLELFDSIQEIAPEIFIHSVYLADSEADDQRAGFFGNIEAVCQQLSSIPELENGFNAVGFSQGGQFLRAYVQRCNDPPVHNLVTVGSQHGGVADIPGCVQSDASCRLMRSIARSGVYSGYVRDHIVQAQYYKDPKNLQKYLERNIFLPDINNELDTKNSTYKQNLVSINKLVMFMFLEDITVKPKETAWFGFKDEFDNVIDLEDQDQYKEDWLGLRTMDEAGKLIFDIMEGEHMQFSLEDFNEMITLPYLLELDEDSHSNGEKKTHRKHRKCGKHQKHEKTEEHHKGMVDQSSPALDWEMNQQQLLL